MGVFMNYANYAYTLTCNLPVPSMIKVASQIENVVKFISAFGAPVKLNSKTEGEALEAVFKPILRSS